MRNRTALVTGASSGIGAAFARELARQGYGVTCVARSPDKLARLLLELGDGHRLLVADLADRAQLQLVADDVEKTGYSLLVNDAGFGIYGRFDEIPVDQQERLLSVNVNALVRLSHVFLKRAVPGDALINVSSVLSLLGYPGGAAYAGSKAFVTVFTESLWYEYKDRGVHVMALLPGVTRTNFLAVATGDRIRSRPGLSYPPETVVRDALAALEARRAPSIVSGRAYRVLTFLATRLVGRKSVIRAMGKGSDGLRNR